MGTYPGHAQGGMYGEVVTGWSRAESARFQRAVRKRDTVATGAHWQFVAADCRDRALSLPVLAVFPVRTSPLLAKP